MTRYRQVLAVPGMAPLLAISLIARTAITADLLVLTMYVVLDLHLSYAAAGAASAALASGLVLGGPMLGRMIDARGVRPVLLLTSAAQLLFWISVPILPYGLLVAASFAAGLLMVPIQVVTRQAIAAMTTPEQRRPGFALDAVQGEVSYVVGPAVVILGAAQISPSVAAWGVGAAIMAGGLGIALLNPPTLAEGEAGVGADTAVRPRRREWLGTAMIAVLVMVLGTTTLLAGVDLAIVAALEEAGQVSWAAVVVAVFGTASVIGGLAYGGQSRSFPTWLLLGLLGLLTIPAGLAGDWLGLSLAMVGAGLLTAPTLTTMTDAVSRLAPPTVRGEATGLQTAIAGAGFTLGPLVVGFAIDVTAPGGGFVVSGLAGLAAALVGYLLYRTPRRPRPHRPEGREPLGSGPAPVAR